MAAYFCGREPALCQEIGPRGCAGVSGRRRSVALQFRTRSGFAIRHSSGDFGFFASGDELREAGEFQCGGDGGGGVQEQNAAAGRWRGSTSQMGQSAKRAGCEQGKASPSRLPGQNMNLALLGPLTGFGNESGADGVFGHILPFFRIVFFFSQLGIPKISLPNGRVIRLGPVPCGA